VSDVLNAHKHCHAVLAMYALGSSDSPDQVVQQRWSEAMQTAFESYDEDATKVVLVVPDDVCKRLHEVSYVPSTPCELCGPARPWKTQTKPPGMLATLWLMRSEPS
jgi:hypothetical protein